MAKKHHQKPGKIVYVEINIGRSFVAVAAQQRRTAGVLPVRGLRRLRTRADRKRAALAEHE